MFHQPRTYPTGLALVVGLVLNSPGNAQSTSEESRALQSNASMGSHRSVGARPSTSTSWMGSISQRLGLSAADPGRMENWQPTMAQKPSSFGSAARVTLADGALIDPDKLPVLRRFKEYPKVKEAFTTVYRVTPYKVVKAIEDLACDPSTQRLKLIIMLPRAFDPVAEVSPAGVNVALRPVAEPATADFGTRCFVQYVVTQPLTGASATGSYHTQQGILPQRVAIAHLVRGSNRFVSGPAVAVATAKLVDRSGNIRATWTWTTNLVLK